MARTYAVRLGGQQGPVAHTRGLYSSAAVTDTGLSGSASVAISDRTGLRSSLALSATGGAPLLTEADTSLLTEGDEVIYA